MQATNEKVELLGTVDARARIGVSEHDMKKLVAEGIFTDARRTPNSHPLYCSDELDRWAELTAQGLPCDRVFAGVMQLRRERKRVKK